MSLATSLGSAAPGGTSVSIAAAITNPASVGDLVIVAFCWATSSINISTVTDTSGNTWNIVQTNAAVSEVGGYAWTIVTTGWSTNTVTATLASGTPGGRCWVAAKVPAANVTGTPLDQNNQGTAASTSTPSLTTSSALAQASEILFLVSAVRETSTTVPTWTSPTPSGAAVIVSQTNGGTVTSGVAILEVDNSVGTSAVTMGYTATTAAGNHGLGIIAFKEPGGGGGSTLRELMLTGVGV